jgi:protein-S-isoprenylcysteine O-methyltransferase Ste14
MSQASVFRILFALCGAAMLVIRVYYQSRVLHDSRKTTVTGNNWRLIPTAVAAATSIVFSSAYIFFPSVFPWSYARCPDWLRWAGAAMLLAGTLLLWSPHHHLGASFHSLVVRRAGQALVESGPYRSIRHPIYTAYFLDYLGGGLLASSLILTFVCVPLFLAGVALRIREGEATMISQFGQDCVGYVTRTGRFLPSLQSLLRRGP